MVSKMFTVFSGTNNTQLYIKSKPVADGPPCLKDDEVYIEGRYGKEYLLINNEVVLKPESSITISSLEAVVSIGTITLSNMPNPTRVTITGNGQIFNRNITDGSYSFSLDVAGDYTVKCEADTELPIEFQVRII